MADFELSGNKWGNTGMGTSGGQVTWSFATTTGATFAFDAYITDPAFQQAIRDAFATWERVANIDFVEVADSRSVDIRLGWDAIDGAYNTVGQTASSYSPSTHTYIAQEIRFDTAEAWTTNESYLGGDYINFYAVAVHEIGHALGLDHDGDIDSIMYAYTGHTTQLSGGDIAGAQYIYGAASGSQAPVTAGPTTGNDVLTGTDAANAIAGLAGDDAISGLAGNDTLTGNAGNDTIDGGSGNDGIWAGADDNGNDVMIGGDGNDTMAGGAGSDIMYGDGGADLMFGGSGNDFVSVASQSGFTGDGSSAHNTAWAGDGNDTVVGDNTADLLGGGAGNDLINGYGGADIVYGGAGSGANDDVIYGGTGNDTVYAGAGNDNLYGEGDNDALFGGAGNDRLDGGAGNDAIWGGGDNDVLTGGDGADTFGFASGSGVDSIADFNFGNGDRLDLGGQSYEVETDGQGNLELVLSGGGTISFVGHDAADFDSGWIL